MSKIQSLFVGLVLVLNLGFLTFGGVSIEVQVIFSTVLISLFGIPHGAIDHIIYMDCILYTSDAADDEHSLDLV